MLVVLGFTMVITFMVLIMTKRLTPVLALIIVPTIFGLFAGAGLGIGDMVLEALGSLAPTVALLMFAIIYFGLMIDVGLFDPLVRLIRRLAGGDPAKIIIGTAVLAGVLSLDGDGSTTFIITTAAMLPIYLRLGMSPVVLTCVAGLANGTLNIVPWGGPTARAAAALKVSPTDVFVPLVPSLLAGIAIVLVFAWFLGIGERNRLAALAVDAGGTASVATPGSGWNRRGHPPRARGLGAQTLVATRPQQLAPTLTDTMLDPDRATLRPHLFWVNLTLTVAILVLLVLDLLPLAYVFMLGCAVALIINFPRLKQQSERVVAHASSIVGVISMVLAAGVLIGVLNGTGMVDAMADWLVTVIPDSLGGSLAVITGVLSIPMTFFMSNDAFYFGILPVLVESAANYGIEPVEMARASVVGQPVHLQSPLVPAILLLVSLSNVNLGDHHRKVLWRAAVVALVMLAVGVITTAIPW
jgi:CitMHS family citrate-Mg2+:H+ or citrate-Ca2+:H+ symporter